MDYSIRWTGFFMSLLLVSAYALSEQAAKTEIEASGVNYQGVLMINQAAGEGQQQANVRAISVGDTPASRITVVQSRDPLPTDTSLASGSAHIQGNAFSNGKGVLGINQSAGIGNQHINAFRIEIGSFPEGLDDSGLAQSAASSSANSGAVVPQGGDRQVRVDDQAFSGSSGVVQLSQSAGVGNRTVNNLGIRITD